MTNNDAFLKIRRLLNFVFKNKHSNFYHIKYKRAGFNPQIDFKVINDVKKIPLLSREEYEQEDLSRLLFVPEKDINSFCFTAGTTTRKPIFTFYSKNFLGIPKDIEIKHKKILLLISSFRIPFFLDGYRQLKRVPLVLAGDITNLPFSCELASKMGINHIRTTPTLAIILKKYLIKYPNFQNNLRVLTLGGEIISKKKRELLKELYPNQEIYFQYGLSEAAGAPAVQCSNLVQQKEEIFFHPRIDDCYFEIINPNTEENVPFGKQGELVLTNFRNQATPIIRYKTGDMASLRKNNCPCGTLGPLLTIHGKINYNIVNVGGFQLHTEMLERSLMNLHSFLKTEFEAHIWEKFSENKPKIKIKLNLSLRENIKEHPELRAKIEKDLLENWQLSPRLNLKMAIEAGFFEIPQINFVQFPFSNKARQALILHSE